LRHVPRPDETSSSKSGLLAEKLPPNYPLAPLVPAIVIGDKAEDAFRQSMLMSQGSLGIFFGNALVTTLVLGGFALLVVPPMLRLVRHRPPPELGIDQNASRTPSLRRTPQHLVRMFAELRRRPAGVRPPLDVGENPLRRSDVGVRLDTQPGPQHVHRFLVSVAPQADAAIRCLATWARPKPGRLPPAAKHRRHDECDNGLKGGMP